MKQLELSSSQLKSIGFTKKVYSPNELNPKVIINEIKGINSSFVYTSNPKYRWYYRTIIGEKVNNIHLNIQRLPELFMILSCFKIKFNLSQRL